MDAVVVFDSVRGVTLEGRVNFSAAELRHATYKKAPMVDLIAQAELCGGDIGPDFFKKSTRKAKVLIVMLEGPVVRGFVAAYPDPEPTNLYIDLICVKGTGKFTGKALMKFTAEYAKAAGYTELSLSAIPPVIPYYPRLGLQFKYRKTCRDAPVPVPKEVLCHRMSSSDKNPYSAANKPITDFMVTLNHAGVEQVHENKQKETACRKKGITAEEMRKYRCDNDGYVLRKCNLRKPIRESPVPKCPGGKSATTSIWDYLKLW